MRLPAASLVCELNVLLSINHRAAVGVRLLCAGWAVGVPDAVAERSGAAPADPPFSLFLSLQCARRSSNKARANLKSFLSFIFIIGIFMLSVGAKGKHSPVFFSSFKYMVF